ncbi:MAG: hypothetical protein ABW352_23805 [Polyangiales bacterium]
MNDIMAASLLVGVTVSIGCTSMHPMMALPSTVPIDTSAKLVELGDGEGTACQKDILFLFTFESDSSIYTAKARALAAAKESHPAAALIDVSIDQESFTSIIYNERCTVLRGRVVDHATPMPELASQRSAVRACLAPEERELDFSVEIGVDHGGSPRSLRIAEKLAPSTYACILGVFKRLTYPGAEKAYTLSHRYFAAE